MTRALSWQGRFGAFRPAFRLLDQLARTCTLTRTAGVVIAGLEHGQIEFPKSLLFSRYARWCSQEAE